jgi:hypothetical protein
MLGIQTDTMVHWDRATQRPDAAAREAEAHFLQRLALVVTYSGLLLALTSCSPADSRHAGDPAVNSGRLHAPATPPARETVGSAVGAELVHSIIAPTFTGLSWSPFRDVLAYRRLGRYDDAILPGSVEFYDVESDVGCAFRGLANFYPIEKPRPIDWLSDGGVLVTTEDGRTFGGRPCESDGFVEDRRVPDTCNWRQLQVSPGGQYEAITEKAVTDGTGISRFVTRLTSAADTGFELEFRWSEGEMLSDPCDPEFPTKWVDTDTFLVPWTDERGAVLLSTDGRVRDVTSMVAETGQRMEEGGGGLLSADGAFLGQRGLYRLVIGDMGAVSPTVYRSESSEFEKLPPSTRFIGFSPNGRWLLLEHEARPGAQSSVAVALIVDSISRMSVFGDAVPPFSAWSPDSQRVALQSPDGVTVYRMQESGEPERVARIVADRGHHLGPGSWSASGEYLVIGDQGEDTSALLLYRLPRP